MAGERERERGGRVLPRIPLTLWASDRFIKSNPKKSDEKRQRRRAARARAATPFCVHVWPGRTAGIRRSRGWFDTVDKKLTTKSVLCCLSHLLARTALVPQACPLIYASPPLGLRHSQCLGCVWLQGVVRRLGHSDETGSGSRRARVPPFRPPPAPEGLVVQVRCVPPGGATRHVALLLFPSVRAPVASAATTRRRASQRFTLRTIKKRSLEVVFSTGHWAWVGRLWPPRPRRLRPPLGPAGVAGSRRGPRVDRAGAAGRILRMFCWTRNSLGRRKKQLHLIESYIDPSTNTSLSGDFSFLVIFFRAMLPSAPVAPSAPPGRRGPARLLQSFYWSRVAARCVVGRPAPTTSVAVAKVASTTSQNPGCGRFHALLRCGFFIRGPSRSGPCGSGGSTGSRLLLLFVLFVAAADEALT